MKENKNNEVIEEKEYITEGEAREFKNLFKKCLNSYKNREDGISDREWLKALLKEELEDITDEEAEKDSIEIIESIETFDENLESINEAVENGTSKENWLANKVQEASVGMSVNEFGQVLQGMDDMLYQKNMELHEAITRAKDGHIKMSRNLDGNIAENVIAKTTELSGFLQDKNIKVEVRDVFTPNSVDVRAVNIKTGKYENYQLKFGKDAKATIKLIEDGNYNNQRLVVPSEQLDEIKEYFRSKGSNKTITDHIDAWGAKGKKFTKEEVKKMQNLAQEDGIMPTMDYSHYQTKDLALSIGKNAGVMALQNVAITTGFNIAQKVIQGEEIDSEEMVAIALETGVDTGIKVVTAGALQVAIRKGILSIIPKMTPAGIIANVACVGIENIKILSKIAKGDLTLTKGLEQMGRVTTSMVGGLIAAKQGVVIGAALTAWIPVIGPALAVVSGAIGGMVGYFAGSKIGDSLYSVSKKVSKTATSLAKSAWSSVKSVGRRAWSGVKSLFAF